MINLPQSVRDAVESGDVELLKDALNRLEPEQADTVVEHLLNLGIISLDAPGKSGAEDPLLEFEPLLQGIAAVANGAETLRPQIEEIFPQLEENGWHITGAVQQIWEGNRDAEFLCDGLEPQDSELVLRILDLIEMPSPEEVLAEMPQSIQAAFELPEAEFSAAFGKAIEDLPVDEAEDILERLEEAGLIR